MTKIVYICYFSSKELRTILKQRVPFWEKWGRRLAGVHAPKLSDYGVWNVNAINEFEKFDDLEMHVVMPQKFIRKSEHRFKLRGVHYYVFRDEEASLFARIKKFFKKKNEYIHNRKYIQTIISEINPDIIHMVGAENPFYSLSMMDMPTDIPTIIQLQTLINDPGFYENYYMSRDRYDYIAQVEKQVILSSTYVATRAEKYIKIINRDINPNTKFLNFGLALNEPVDLSERKTVFDFVYFAKDIAKAVDYAIESFALAFQKHPGLTLDIVGSFSPELKETLNSRIKELNLADYVTFEGELATHDDVIKQIRKARFALLPVKISLTTGTIREAMANGLPVITTDTGEMGTQRLNKVKECVLLSPKGDHLAMANNMILLLDNAEIRNRLVKNAGEHAASMRSNFQVVKEWHDTYLEIKGEKLH